MFEAIVIRSGFSLYAGWVTAATVLNFFFVQKSWNNPSLAEDGGDDNFAKLGSMLGDVEKELKETAFAVKTAWFCVVLYTAISFYE